MDVNTALSILYSSAERREQYDLVDCVDQTIQSLQAENTILVKQHIEALSDLNTSKSRGLELQKENDRLRTENNITKEMNERLKIDWTKMQKQYQLSVLECCTMELEEKRLRTIEEKARAVDKILNCWTMDEDADISYDFEGICPDEWKCTLCPLKEFKDALKGGSNND